MQRLRLAVCSGARSWIPKVRMRWTCGGFGRQTCCMILNLLFRMMVLRAIVCRGRRPTGYGTIPGNSFIHSSGLTSTRLRLEAALTAFKPASNIVRPHTLGA